MKSISNIRTFVPSKTVFVLLFLFPTLVSAQDLNLIRGGELLFGGLITIFSKDKTENVNKTVVESVCVKNKLSDKITFILIKKTEDGEEDRKELVIQKDSKEYLFELPVGVYSYEVLLANNTVFKKGECKFAEKTTFTISGEIIKNPED